MEMICSSNGEKEEETKEEDIEEDGEEEEEEEEEEEDQEEKEEQQHFHVLAVDDSLIDRKLLERLLRESSCQVTSVDSGDKALEYLGLVDNLDHNASASCSSPQQEGMRVNLIMTDYCMPGMSGYDLLKRVKGSSWKDVPVVVMSSENIPSRISMCLEEGAKEFLLKPLQLSDVKKLQPHLLKSLDNDLSCTKTNDPFDDSDSNNVINNDKRNNISSNGSISKRKALSPESSDRRPKLK